MPVVLVSQLKSVAVSALLPKLDPGNF